MSTIAPYHPAITAMLTEGIFDPHILKAVFMAGGGGSGKSFIAELMFKGMGVKFSNSDTILEKMAAAMKLDLSDPDVMGAPVIQAPTFGVRARAKALSSKREALWLAGRLGLVLDSTAAKTQKVLRAKKRLEDQFGYDTSMVFVNTSLETSLERNLQRPRRVPEDVVRSDWERVQQARDLYERTFGTANFVEIQNDVFYDAKTLAREIKPKLTRLAMRFLNKPLKNPVGKAWIEEQTA